MAVNLWFVKWRYTRTSKLPTAWFHKIKRINIVVPMTDGYKITIAQGLSNRLVTKTLCIRT